MIDVHFVSVISYEEKDTFSVTTIASEKVFRCSRTSTAFGNAFSFTVEGKAECQSALHQPGDEMARTSHFDTLDKHDSGHREFIRGFRQ